MIKNPEILNEKRKLSNRGTRKVIYKFPSLINKKIVACESGLEWKMCHHFELDYPSIQSYESQPHKLVYYDDTKMRSYTPDFLVIQSGVQKVVEVKPEEKLPLHLQKLHQVKTAYAIENIQFVVITDKYIEKQPRLENAKLILRHSRQRVTRTSLKAIVDLCRHCRDPVTIRFVLDQLAPKNVQEKEIFKLIYAGIIRFDPKGLLSRDSAIWLNKNVNV